MSLSEFRQLTDLVKRQSSEIEQLYKELELVADLKDRLLQHRDD